MALGTLEGVGNEAVSSNFELVTFELRLSETKFEKCTSNKKSRTASLAGVVVTMGVTVLSVEVVDAIVKLRA